MHEMDVAGTSSSGDSDSSYSKAGSSPFGTMQTVRVAGKPGTQAHHKNVQKYIENMDADEKGRLVRQAMMIETEDPEPDINDNNFPDFGTIWEALDDDGSGKITDEEFSQACLMDVCPDVYDTIVEDSNDLVAAQTFLFAFRHTEGQALNRKGVQHRETDDLTQEHFMAAMQQFHTECLREGKSLGPMQLFKLYILLAAKEASHTAEHDMGQKLEQLIDSGQFKSKQEGTAAQH